MKEIKIRFSGMGGNFDPEDNFIVNALRERYRVVLSEDPDYLFYSVLSTDFLKYSCVRIFFTAENLVPDFNLCDYGIGFARMDFGDRYLRYPLYLVESFAPYRGDDYATELQRAEHKHEHAEEALGEKTDFCAFVYSNGEAAPCREKIFRALSDYKPVNSGGRYLNNIGGPVENKREFQRKHKFVIAFENTSTPGYTTEKIVHAFSAGAVPIYWGNPEITREFNPGSFVDCNAMGLTAAGEDRAIREIVRRVEELDRDGALYRKALETPAFTEENNTALQKERFREFLFNIFDQPKEEAYRRNRFYWGARYERKQRIGNDFYRQCRKLIPLRDALRKLKK